MISREIGHQKSSGTTGYLCPEGWPRPSGAAAPPGGLEEIQSVSCFRREDISSRQSTTSSALSITISCRAMVSFFRSFMVVSCSFSDILLRVPRSRPFSARAHERSMDSCSSGELGLPFALRSCVRTSSSWEIPSAARTSMKNRVR